ncbi:MAG: hypothetical protein ABIM50_04425 [Novosphingobium sp.]
MTMTTIVAQTRIAREITDAETALNDALLKQAQLFTTMVAARRDTEVEQFTGQDALMRLAKSQQSLLTAGGDLARVHGRLLEVNCEMGGLADDCPVEGHLSGLINEAIAA